MPLRRPRAIGQRCASNTTVHTGLLNVGIVYFIGVMFLTVYQNFNIFRYTEK